MKAFAFPSLLLALLLLTPFPLSAKEKGLDFSDADEEEVEEESEEEADDEEKTKKKKSKSKTKTKKKSKKTKPPKKKKKGSNPNRRKSTGVGLTLSVGPSVAFRRMQLKGSIREISHTPNLYIGGVLSLGLRLYSNRTFGHLLLAAEGGFGSAQNSDIDGQSGRPLVTENAFFTFHLVNEKPLSSDLDLRFLLGVGATSYVVEPNARYTGHRYLTVDIGTEIKWWTSSRFNTSLGAFIRPSFFTNQSSDADGEGSGFGAKLRTHLEYRLIAPKEKDLASSLDIRLQAEGEFFQSSFPLSGRVGSDPVSFEHHYLGMLALRYHL